jgi:hypothetical protein
VEKIEQEEQKLRHSEKKIYAENFDVSTHTQIISF